MIGSWEIDELDRPTLDHRLAMAHLDSAIVVARGMSNGQLPATFSHSRVALSLTYHATELFLKAAILRKAALRNPCEHQVSKLWDEYREHYRSPEYDFEIPFSIGYLGFTAEEIERLVPEEPPLDQTYRYHTDLKGNPWKGVHGFAVDPFVEAMQSLRTRLMEIGERLHMEQNKDGQK